MFVPEVNFKFSTLEKEIGPLCTGGCEKMVCMAEIQVTSDSFRWPARIFGDKMCTFAVICLLRTLFVTLYYMDPPIQNCPIENVHQSESFERVHAFFVCTFVNLNSFHPCFFCRQSGNVLSTVPQHDIRKHPSRSSGWAYAGMVAIAILKSFGVWCKNHFFAVGRNFAHQNGPSVSPI